MKRAFPVKHFGKYIANLFSPWCEIFVTPRMKLRCDTNFSQPWLKLQG